MSSPTAGRCACGNLKYSFEGEPVGIAMCYCISCRRTSGSAFSTTLILLAPAFSLLEGTPKTYAHRGDSGKDSVNHFCPECGSLVFIKSEAAPGLIFVKSGSLEDLSMNETKYKPRVATYCRDKYSWLPDIEAVQMVDGALEV